MKKLALLLALAWTGLLHAQIATTNAPRTYFDAFNATTDTVLVKGMTVIGVLNNQISFPVEIRIEHLTNMRTTNTVYAVALRTTLNNGVQVDYIDYDELDALIHGVTQIAQANNTVTPLENYEAVFRTRGGLSIAKFVRTSKTTITLTSDIYNTHNQMAPFVLDDFNRFLIAAKTKIDAVAATGR